MNNLKKYNFIQKYEIYKLKFLFYSFTNKVLKISQVEERTIQL